MYIAEIAFYRADPTAEITEELEELLEQSIYGLLTAWRNNGQIGLDVPVISRVDGGYEVQVIVPFPNTLNLQQLTESSRQALNTLKDSGIGLTEVMIVGSVLGSSEACTCVERNSFILFSTFLIRTSPVYCGECFLPVPLYELPTTTETGYQDVYYWQTFYNACDTLGIQNKILKAGVTAEMSNPYSELSRLGRGICQRIEADTGKPTYYHIVYNPAQEGEPKCPQCGGDWRLSEPWHIFDLKCEQDRLVASLPYND